MTDFITMVNRIALELRRSNMTDQIKNAINDAIAEEAKYRLYINEMYGVPFQTAIGWASYPDLGVSEIDSMYYVLNGVRSEIYPGSQLAANRLAEGNVITGFPENYSRYGEQIIFDPVPNMVLDVYIDGYGKLDPWPLVADTATNAWMTTGERLIRASAKAILLKDIVRDYGEAAALEGIAADFRRALEHETTLRSTTNSVVSTQW